MATLMLILGLGAFSFISHAGAFSVSRRQALDGIAGAATTALPANAAPAPLKTSAGTVRVEEIGGGLDLISPPPLSASDVFYPSSMINTNWKVQRVITSVEGDVGQAALVWRLLGGSSSDKAFAPNKFTEVYEASFLAAPDTMHDASYEFEGKPLHAAILDRGSELSSRLGLKQDSVIWEGDSIEYSQRKSNDAAAANLRIVKRKIEPPSADGFGSDEVYRIESTAGGIFSGQNIYRAAKVRRRYRRAFDETGKRIIDCIEIVTTHRVLDGVAQVELPTSTCKSRLRYAQL